MKNGCNISELTQKIFDLIENYNESDGGDTKIPHLGNFKTKKDTIGYSTSRDKDGIKTYLRNTGTDLEVTIDGKRPESEILDAISTGIKAWHHDVGFTDSVYYFCTF